MVMKFGKLREVVISIKTKGRGNPQIKHSIFDADPEEVNDVVVRALEKKAKAGYKRPRSPSKRRAASLSTTNRQSVRGGN